MILQNKVVRFLLLSNSTLGWKHKPRSLRRVKNLVQTCHLGLCLDLDSVESVKNIEEQVESDYRETPYNDV